MPHLNKFFLFFLLGSAQLFAQTPSAKYRQLDSLINTGTIFDGMTALSQLNSKFKNDTIHSDYWIRYAKACLSSFKDAEAMNSIDKALLLDPKNADAHFYKGKFLFDIKKEKLAAINSIDRAIRCERKGLYYFYRGIYEQVNDSLTLAMADYDTASQLKYVHEGLFRNYSILLFRSDHPEKALIFINKAIALEPMVPENYSTRSDIYLMLMEPDKCCADYQHALNLGYAGKSDVGKILCKGLKTSNKFRTAGDILFKLEKYSFAITAYSKAMELEKDSSVLYLNRGYCYYKIKDYSRSEKDYLKALSFKYHDLDLLYDDLSLLYFDQEKFDKTIEYATKRIELDPKNPTPYIDRGLAERRLKDYKNAENDFNKALSIKPDFHRALGYRSYLYLEQGKFEKAIEDAQTAVALVPEYGYGYLVLGQAKQALGVPGFCLDLMSAKKYGFPEAEELLKKYCK